VPAEILERYGNMKLALNVMFVNKYRL